MDSSFPTDSPEKKLARAPCIIYRTYGSEQRVARIFVLRRSDIAAIEEPAAQPISVWGWLPVLLAVISAYLIINFLLPRLPLPVWAELYVMRPALWLAVGALGLFTWRRHYSVIPLWNQPIIMSGLMAGLMQVALFVIAGFVLGFGQSPYDHRLIGIAGNLLFVLATLAGMEFARACLLHALLPHKPGLALGAVTLMFGLATISLPQFGALTRLETGFPFAGEMLLPALANSLLASILASIGGPLPAIAYGGALLAFEWLSPILPAFRWTERAFLGTVIPILLLLVVYSLHAPEESGESTAEREQRSPLFGWVIVGVFAIVMLWFNGGYFGLQPTLISGPSMNPTLWAGDIVIIREVSLDTIEIGDIIRFEEDGRFVLHRVKVIGEGRSYFITRGDNNNVDDDPVLPSHVRGKVIFTIPKLGWFAIWMRQLSDIVAELIAGGTAGIGPSSIGLPLKGTML